MSHFFIEAFARNARHFFNRAVREVCPGCLYQEDGFHTVCGNDSLAFRLEKALPRLIDITPRSDVVVSLCVLLQDADQLNADALYHLFAHSCPFNKLQFDVHLRNQLYNELFNMLWPLDRVGHRLDDDLLADLE